jgi:PAS domain S-box-containing protein
MEELKDALDEHAIVAITDPQGKILYVNDKFCAISKYAREELLGQDHRLINSGFHSKEFIRNLWTTIAQGKVWNGEIKNTAKDGSFYWVDTTIVPFLNEAGKPRQYVALRTDITERKRTELAALRLAAIVAYSQDAIIAKDLNGIVTTWNKAAERIFGYTVDEILGTSITRLIPAGRQEEESHILGAIRRGESVEHFETLRQTKDGRLLPISVTASPIKDAAGNVIGVSKVARDISERKLAEDEIQQLNAELEQRVVERTAQLQAANKELEAFCYSVSHDLRVPLRHVQGFVQLLHKDIGELLPAKSLRQLDTISQAAKRMGDLIDDLLASSRLARSKIRTQPVQLDGLVQEALNDFAADTKERNIAWEIRPLPDVRADRALLRQALLNLISNAVKFTATRAEAKIEIGCGAGNQREAVIFVRDNGEGFDPRYAHKLFGVFQRLHNQNEFEGTGIGLANVQRIIQRHGGRAWAEGVVDGGATFYFSIPKQVGGVSGN